MMKKILKILSVITLLMLVIAGIFFYSIYISVDRVNLSYETITSSKIPKAMDGVKIAFLSDFKYNDYMKKERLTKMIDKLNEAGSDIVVFGGDMFANTKTSLPDSKSTKEVTTILKNIKAPLGKFAVLGDQDQENEEIKKIVETVLYDSDFEIIENSTVRLRKNNSAPIALIGLDSLINGNMNPQNAFKTIDKEEFNLLVTHCPDAVNSNEFNTQYVDVIVSGHSLGGQIYIPMLGPLQPMEGAKKYNHGIYKINNTRLFVSNGLGTENIDMRLLAPPQIPIFRLQSTVK